MSLYDEIVPFHCPECGVQAESLVLLSLRFKPNRAAQYGLKAECVECASNLMLAPQKWFFPFMLIGMLVALFVSTPGGNGFGIAALGFWCVYSIFLTRKIPVVVVP